MPTNHAGPRWPPMTRAAAMTYNTVSMIELPRPLAPEIQGADA